MRPFFALAASFAAAISIAAVAQEPQSAPEGRNLLLKPAGAPSTRQHVPPGHTFVPDPSGGFSRIIFETEENPDFKITIRDFAFPPDRQPHSVSIPSHAFIHLLSGEGEISVSKKRLELMPGARLAVYAGAQLEVIAGGNSLVVVRAFVVEVK